ncbi:MAG TPA: hypothetical protein ENI64_03460 [Gammaproteobacteria bacterium]|nr:hypothetical protein [Gammaproteobacteria bacterium]
MSIEGPLSVSVTEMEEPGKRELHISFNPDFQSLALEQQGSEFSNYVDRLKQQSSQSDADSAEQQGIMTILQIAEQLLPHIQSGEIPLMETIVIEIHQQPGLADLIKQNEMH